MKKLLVLTIFMVTLFTNAQIKLTGVVKDSIGEALEMANVLAINKTTKKMASYGFTDAKGNYKLDLDRNGIFTIKISYVGMKTADFEVETKDKNLVKNVTLAYDNTLDEINIVSKMPVTIKGDTIIYNADSFKNGSERKLEDVLKKIPGMEVNDEGEIEVEGKKVGKLMVDGKDFFDGDTKLATKNIPANAIDKVQVLKNYGEVNQLRGVQNNEDNIALNIQLKKGKKNFWFGDVTVGGGDSDRESLYVLQPKLFYYSPKYSVNVIGDLNNIGEVVFSRRDARNFSGGFRSPSASSGTNISLGDNDIGFLTLQNNRANSIDSKLLATNFSYSPKKTLDLSGFAIFSNSKIQTLQNSSVLYTDPSLGIPDETTTNNTIQNTTTSLFKLSANYKPDVNNQLDYDFYARTSTDSQDQDFFSSNLGVIKQEQSGTPFSINQNFNYYYTLNEKNIFAFSAQSLIQDEDPLYNAILEDKASYSNTGDALGLDNLQTGYNINQGKRVKTGQIDAKLDYWNVLNDKSNINFTLGTIYSKQSFDSDIFQRLDDGSEFNPTPVESLLPDGFEDPQNINNIDYKFTDLYLGTHYQFKTGKFTITPGFTAHIYNVENDQFSINTKDNFFRLLPDFNMRISLKQSENISLTYRMQTQFTDVNQFAKGLVLNNYNSIFSGNPELENALSHNVNLRYFSFNMFNYTNVFAFINYNKRMDQVTTNAQFNPGSVVSVRSPENSQFANESLTFSGRFQKTFRKYRASLNTSLSYSKYAQEVNNKVSNNKSFTQTYRSSFGTNFTKAPNVTLNYTFRLQNSDLGERNTKRYTNTPSIQFDAYIWEKLTFRTEYEYSGLSDGTDTLNSFDFWDASLIYRSNKDSKWEYQLKATNLLDTRSQSNASIGSFSVNTVDYFIQPRFLTLRMIYQL
ncbi:carboxypeptidase-like regulatory domain-containing protein [uncultured Polaribacter sp.]|uniref:carboxypeptidase-like regulatory domain-containing protein n=1 Tax=uncultured Polaribacter sp. TaxID=174711 RepID=UPI002609811E|nr:carboxypeptidase-like regulatory domain-containing protein [uncultured Polaribacter sp.]